MHGNVWDWCADWYEGYSSGVITDPAALSSGEHRVLRGGGWSHPARSSAFRNAVPPNSCFGDVGIRIVFDK